MGLDMYLKAERDFSGWNHAPEAERRKYAALLDFLGIPAGDIESPNAEASVTVAYWRKANQVHNWFVQNCQDGEDECRPCYVPREKLAELIELCRRALRERDAEILPPVAGFFFGTTDIDEQYWETIELTVPKLEKVLRLPAEFNFYYQSSW